MPSFFARLPTEIQVTVLQTIINTGAGSLIPFLRAFPDLAHLVLLISDHTSSPFQLIDIPGIEAVDLGDHQLIARLCPAKPITVLSFKNCDEEAGIGRLTRSPDCAYGKYIDSKSAVFVELRGKALLGNSFIRELAELKGCEAGKSLIIQHLRKLVSPSHIEIDRTGNAYIKPLISTDKLCIFKFPDRTVPYAVFLSFLGSHASRFISWANITSLTLYNALLFAGIGLPHLKTLRLSKQERGCRGRLQASAAYDAQICDFPWYDLNYAPKLDQIYYEFAASRTPILCCGPQTCRDIKEADQFSFINQDWSENDPSLSSALCPHAIGHGKDYLEWSEYPPNVEPLTFLSIFRRVTFVGIPDSVVIQSSFTNARTLTWKRLVTAEPDSSPDPQSTIPCPSLESLHLSTLLTVEQAMPKIDAPVLQSMDLCAVYDSTTAWDLPFHFTKETLASVENVSMVFKQREDTPGLPMLLADIEPLKQNLQSLRLVGCLPLFLLDSVDTVESNVVFSKLTSLSVDMEYLPLETIKGKPRPLVSVLLDRDTFPVLKELTLTLEFPERSALLSGGVCDVKIQVTSSCQFLAVPCAIPSDGQPVPDDEGR